MCPKLFLIYFGLPSLHCSSIYFQWGLVLNEYLCRVYMFIQYVYLRMIFFLIWIDHLLITPVAPVLKLLFQRFQHYVAFPHLLAPCQPCRQYLNCPVSALLPVLCWTLWTLLLLTQHKEGTLASSLDCASKTGPSLAAVISHQWLLFTLHFLFRFLVTTPLISPAAVCAWIGEGD